MDSHGTHRATEQSPTPRGRRPAHGQDPFALIRDRGRTAQQREACAAFLRYAARCAPNGGPVDRTWRQIAKGLGKPVDGLTDRQTRQKYRPSIRATIDYLTAWGLLDGRHTLWEANGEGRCIVFSVPAGVAQSVRAAACAQAGRRRPGGSQGRRDGGRRGGESHFFSREVSPPSRESAVDVDVSSSQVVETAGRARVSLGAAGSASDRARVHAQRRGLELAALAAIDAGWEANSASGEGGSLAEVAAVQEAPVSTVARALFVRALPGVAPRLSAKRQAQLEAAAARLDRYSGPGEWIRVAVSVLDGWTEGDVDGFWLSEPPRSLGALALELRREANLRRHGALERRRQRLRPLAAARRRQQIKRWRQEIREHARRYPGLRPAELLLKPWREAPGA